MTDKDNKRISNQFGCFCSRGLKNEAHNIHSEYAKQREHETSLTELSSDKLLELSANDTYSADEHIFKALDKEIVVVGDELANALIKLPPEKLEIILLSYFMDMTDAEIGRALNAIQQTICKRRTSTLKLLRDYLEKEGIQWDDIWNHCNSSHHKRLLSQTLIASVF